MELRHDCYFVGVASALNLGQAAKMLRMALLALIRKTHPWALALVLVLGHPSLAADRVSQSQRVSAGDYPSLQAAIAQNPGRCSSIPSGRHVLSDTVILSHAHTELAGPGILVQANSNLAIIEVRADHVRVRDLTLTRAEGAMETTRDAIEATGAAFTRIENVQIVDNHSSGASVRLQDCRFGRITGCVIENYKRVAVDDRTTSSLHGYAFRCLDGAGIVISHGRGHQILDNHILEHRLLPTRETKERHRLGELTEGRQPTRFGELGRAMERARFVRQWHQGSAIVVSGPEDTEFIRVAGNYMENCAQGIDLHCDNTIVANNTVNRGMIGIKAMHGSRHLVISDNILSRVDLWGIMVGPGAASHAAEPAAQGRPARPANTDGGIRVVGNLIADYGYGNEYWNWGGDPEVSSSFAIRIDRGQLTSNPGIRDVLVQGNIVTEGGQDGVVNAGEISHPQPRHRYAFYLELPNKDESDYRYPKNIQVLDNLFTPGTSGVGNVALPYHK